MFLNDHEVFRDSTETNNDFDTYIVHTELQQGWNRILIKVGYSEIDRCNFLARITDDQGNPIAGLKESSVKQMYTAKKPDLLQSDAGTSKHSRSIRRTFRKKVPA